MKSRRSRRQRISDPANPLRKSEERAGARGDSAASVALALRPAPQIALDWLFCGYLVLMAFSFAVLRMPGVMPHGNELNADRAIFTVVNAATLSGFQLNVAFGQLDSSHPLGALVVLLLTLAGALFSLITGGLAAVRVLRLPFSDRQVVNASLLSTAAALVVGTAGLMGAHRTPGDALLQSASAFGNGGLYTGRLPGLGDWQTHLILLPLAIIGGLGLPVLMELYAWLRVPSAEGSNGNKVARLRPALSTHTRTVLWLTALLYVAGLVLLLVSREEFWETLWSGFTTGRWTPAQATGLRYMLLSSSAASINSRTAGFPFEYTDMLARVSQWVLLVLMVIGANPASTGGGLKATTALQLFRGARDALLRRRVPRAFGIAATWLGIYALIVALGFALLLWQVPQLPADKLLLLSVSAASNVGLSHDALSLVVGPLYTLSLVMIAGRIAPLIILWWMARTTDDAELLVA